MDKFIVDPNNPNTMSNLLDYLRLHIAEKIPLQVVAKPFTRRSLDQNSLFHVWCSEYFNFVTKTEIKDFNYKDRNTLMTGFKRGLKRACYADTQWYFLLVKLKDPFTGKEETEAESTRNYTPGEMFQFMEWVQNRAAEDGLILESKGEYYDRKEASVL